MLNATTTAGAQLRNLVIIVICIALLAGINVVFNDYIVRVISTIFIFMILAVSYNLINGVTGQLSLEPNGFVAVGAYVTALLATGMILQLVWSKYGRMMKAIRDDEDAAIAMGVNTFRIKTCAFATSAFFEGIGGGLLASLLTTISPGLFDFMLTFQLLIIIVLGGLGSTTGALLGTVLVVGSGEWLRFLDQPLQFFGHDLGAYPGLRMVVFSLLLLIIMLFAREGLLGKKEIWQMGRRNSSYGGK
ncbi:hypothetical protein LOCUS_48740 [Klebsiella pneumoniae]|uniref:branched-chain amino acid ABC transporter permease n=1 Tax=Klebsiella pneumoniae TaxID=573 RepID=UPI0029AC10A4|nr:hypothetical protein LOCUS_48740 [Klebsiella pneumoniae]